MDERRTSWDNNTHIGVRGKVYTRPRIGDLVISSSGRWDKPRLVTGVGETAKNLYGVLFDTEIRYVHYKHLEVVSESR